MVGSTGLMKMRSFRSKLRKRDASPVVDCPENLDTPHRNQQYQQNIQHAQIIGLKSTEGGLNQQPSSRPWVFPPLPVEPTVCNINQLALMQTNQEPKNGFKGLKRQLSGRFKRIISRKPIEPLAPIIPPELKAQLRTIYVY